MLSKSRCRFADICMWIVVKAVGLHVESGSSPSGVSRWTMADCLFPVCFGPGIRRNGARRRSCYLRHLGRLDGGDNGLEWRPLTDSRVYLVTETNPGIPAFALLNAPTVAATFIV